MSAGGTGASVEDTKGGSGWARLTTGSADDTVGLGELMRGTKAMHAE